MLLCIRAAGSGRVLHREQVAGVVFVTGISFWGVLELGACSVL